MVTGSRFIDMADEGRLPLVRLAADRHPHVLPDPVAHRGPPDHRPHVGPADDRPPRHRALRPRLPARLPRGRGDRPEPRPPLVGDEVPVRMRARVTGRSSIGSTQSVYYMIKVTLARVRRPAARAPGDRAPATPPPSTRSTASSHGDGPAHPAGRDRRRRRPVLHRLRARAAQAAAWSATRCCGCGSTVVLLGLAVWKDLLVTVSTRDRDLLRAVRAVRGDARRSSSCCCCTSRWSSRAWRTRTRCWPRSSASCSNASRSLESGAGRDRRALGAHDAHRDRLAALSWPAAAVVIVGHDSADALPRTLRCPARRSSARATRSWSSTARRATGPPRSARAARRGAPCSSPARTSGSPAAATRAPTRRPRRCSSC